jgi:hypothetical protein
LVCELRYLVRVDGGVVGGRGDVEHGGRSCGGGWSRQNHLRCYRHRIVDANSGAGVAVMVVEDVVPGGVDGDACFYRNIFCFALKR